MSQLSLEQQVRGIIIRAKFANSEINALVEDVAHLDIGAVLRCAEGLKCDVAASARDIQNADMVIGSIARLKNIDQQREQTERGIRQQTLIEQAANSFDRSNLK